jgi:hypothetical protein
MLGCLFLLSYTGLVRRLFFHLAPSWKCFHEIWSFCIAPSLQKQTLLAVIHFASSCVFRDSVLFFLTLLGGETFTFIVEGFYICFNSLIHLQLVFKLLTDCPQIYYRCTSGRSYSWISYCRWISEPPSYPWSSNQWQWWPWWTTKATWSH